MTDFTNFLNENLRPNADYDYDLGLLEELCSADVDRMKVNGFRTYKDSSDQWVIDLSWTDYTQMYAGGDYKSVTSVPLAVIQAWLSYEARLLFHFHITDYNKRATIEARNIKANYATFEAILKGEC